MVVKEREHLVLDLRVISLKLANSVQSLLTFRTQQISCLRVFVGRALGLLGCPGSTCCTDLRKLGAVRNRISQCDSSREIHDTRSLALSLLRSLPTSLSVSLSLSRFPSLSVFLPFGHSSSNVSTCRTYSCEVATTKKSQEGNNQVNSSQVKLI